MRTTTVTYGPAKHTTEMSYQALPAAGLALTPGLSPTGTFNGCWTVRHIGSGLVINDPTGFDGHFSTLAGAYAFAQALVDYFPDVDFTADAEDVRDHLRHDSFALTKALDASLTSDHDDLRLSLSHFEDDE
ncbi:hypothetical protein [Cryptosporangium arvum]|uniref:Uncharacterized protein n=1 Tax=Cryptosporangium arvum DSM 44712 TaxID=927661 RepID=A0A010ZKJ1_9ACTN|nr:hypothetical protein [Cryptosporangium arvum]EXG79169.1 hypothetical protein CryarDRAFT_0195 [Cryptosporangium arvum DSM 44712]